MGKAWHDDGRMMHKKNTFTDFIASAEYLVAQGYGSKDRLRSKDEALAACSWRCSEYAPGFVSRGACRRSLRGRLNTMLDESLPLTVSEFEEWGNPKEKPAFDYMIPTRRMTTSRPKRIPTCW